MANLINFNGGKVHNGSRFSDVKLPGCLTGDSMKVSKGYRETDAPVNCKKCLKNNAAGTPVAASAPVTGKVAIKDMDNASLFIYKGETVEILAMENIFGSVTVTLVTEDRAPWDVRMNDNWMFEVVGQAA